MKWSSIYGYKNKLHENPGVSIVYNTFYETPDSLYYSQNQSSTGVITEDVDFLKVVPQIVFNHDLV